MTTFALFSKRANGGHLSGPYSTPCYFHSHSSLLHYLHSHASLLHSGGLSATTGREFIGQNFQRILHFLIRLFALHPSPSLSNAILFELFVAQRLDFLSFLIYLFAPPSDASTRSAPVFYIALDAARLQSQSRHRQKSACLATSGGSSLNISHDFVLVLFFKIRHI